MPLDTTPDGRQVHMPKNKNKFEFDGEVATVFDDMARRSIPLFFETHAQHARVARPWLEKPGCTLLDIGASRGAFLRAVDREIGLDQVRAYATDNSPAMVNFLSKDFPDVSVSQVDITASAFLRCPKQYDVINMTYVLQFIRPELQRTVLSKVCSMVKPGGVLFLGHKRENPGLAEDLLHHEYIKWRVDNGYTLEEIEAKTYALKSSMWPMQEDVLIGYLHQFGMGETARTSSWTVFSNFMCIKR